jgi:quercetin dioxygenase-like cupin family protein
MSFMNLKDIEERELVPGFRARMVHTDSMTLAYWEVDAGAALTKHTHTHEQVVNVIQGVFELTVGDETRRIRPGDVVTIASNVAHAGIAVTDCRILDIFHPVREDYR